MEPVDSPHNLPWVGLGLLLVWLSLLLPGLFVLAMIALVVAVPTTLLTTLVGAFTTPQFGFAEAFRLVLGVAGGVGLVAVTLIPDVVSCHVGYGLLATVYLVLLSANDPWGTSPVFLLLVGAASAGATAATFLPPFHHLPRTEVAWRTLLYSLPLGLGLGLFIGFLKRLRGGR